MNQEKKTSPLWLKWKADFSFSTYTHTQATNAPKASLKMLVYTGVREKAYFEKEMELDFKTLPWLRVGLMWME